MTWELKKVEHLDWTQDKSGYFTYIHYVKRDDAVRLDVMSDNLEPVISFQGKADNVRKATMRWFNEKSIVLSLEHASYVGSELTKAGLLGTEYIQD